MSIEKYPVAHINQQGSDLIIVPVSSSVNSKSSSQQSELKKSFQYHANSAGLNGSVCLVWEHGRRFFFFAPNHWHGFLKSIDMSFVTSNINQEITCKSA